LQSSSHRRQTTDVPDNAAVLDRLVEYARSGGHVVIGLAFSTFVYQDNMEAVFARFGLPWKHSNYQQSTFALNRQATCDLDSRNLRAAYSQNALRVAHVEPQNMLYLVTSNSVVESRVFAPTPVGRGETPIAWIKVGDGYLGYVGDVNAEEESDYVIMAMCGLGGRGRCECNL
jgi:hypothetical protein